MKRFFLLFITIPFVAFAQAPTAPSPLAGLLEQFLTPTGIASVVVTVLGIVFTFWKLADRRKEQVATAAFHAFHLVNDLALTTENTVDDKVAAGLRAANEYMLANRWRTLRPEETDVAKLKFSSMNGAEKSEEKIRANALEAAKASPPPVA